MNDVNINDVVMKLPKSVTGGETGLLPTLSEFSKVLSVAVPMARTSDFRDVEKKKETMEFEWIITDFFSKSKESYICSSGFSFAGTSWHLEISGSDINESETILLQLSSHRQYSVIKYSLGLKKVDSSVERLSQGILKESYIGADICHIELSEIEQRKSELAPSNTLTIVCTLTHEVTRSDQADTLDLPKRKKLKRLNTLSDNFKKLFANKASCDTTLQVMDKEYKAHKAVLMARSSVFAAMFLHETIEKQTGIINIPDCDPESFEEFLQFLYTGKLEKPFSRSLFQLYDISDKYDVQELKTFCLEFLIESLTIENLCDSVIFAYKYDETDLLSATQKMFRENVSKVLDSNEWDCLVEKNYSLSKTFLKEAWGK